MKLSALSILLSLFMVGCAKINDAGMRLLSSSAPALAVVHDTLLVGKAMLFTDRTGTLNLESSTEPRLKCMGNLRYTASKTGVASLKCSDGADVLMTFTATSETRGYGSGQTARGPASFTFGLEPADAAAYLTLPVNQRIVSTAEGVRLAPR